MLGRNSSKRLSRRKSISSVHSKHESIDPQVARQHAHAAATLAFTRAQERNSTDMGYRGAGPLRTNTTSSHQDQQPLSQQSDASNINRGIKRQQSVRFVGPSGVQRGQSINNKTADNSVRPKSSTATLRPVAITTNAPVPAAYRPPSRSSSLGRASTGKGTAESFVTSLAAYNEYYTREDDLASTPSSYRRIRRSRSMFSPLKAPNCFYTNGTPERQGSENRGGALTRTNSHTNPIDAPTMPLRAPKSASFLRGGQEDPMSGLRDRNDEAVQMARDRFFHQTAQQRLREQPSFIFRSKARRQEKPFRKSVRSSSTNSHDVSITSSNQAHLTETGLKEKARRASQNIRSKLRRVFLRNKEEPVAVPNQQVDARETHVRHYPGDFDSRHNSFNNIPHPSRATLSRVASRPPSLHAATSSQQLRSHAGSVRSTRSGHSDDKSRVTSWNSTGVNTIASQGAKLQAERELQRLSIINENGTHVTSSSFNREKLANQFSAYPVVHRPSKSAGHVPASGPGPVDSARVYSALMKRLDENSPKAKIEALRKASVESLAPPKHIPPRSSSAHSTRGNRTPATIRQVLAESSNSSSREFDSAKHAHQWVEADSLHAARAEDAFGCTGTHVHQWVTADPLREARMRDQDDVFSPKHCNGNKENLSIDMQRGRSGSNAPTREPSMKTSYHTATENLGFTPQELAYRNEPSIQGTRCLREARATFFGGTRITIARTTSPFRRAVAESDHNSAVTTDDAPASGYHLNVRNSLFSSPASITVADNAVQDSDVHDKAYSASLYSRTTSGQTPAAANSTLSLPMPENDIPEMPFPDTSPGDVVILDRATYRPSMPGDKSHRVTSSASSTEWKKWMSSEVAKLERAKDNTNASASYVNYALPSMPRSVQTRHVRENAQIMDDDTEIIQRNLSAVQKSFGTLQHNTVNKSTQKVGHQSTPLLKPILKNGSQVENRDSITTNTPSIPVPPPPPPIPVRSPLRPMQSKSSLRSVNTINTFNTACTQSAPSSAVKVPSMSGRNLLHKRNASQTTLRSATSAETPAKLVKRHGRKPAYAGQPSPASSLGVAIERQFGSTGTRPRNPGVPWGGDKENDNPQQMDELYGSDGAGLMGPSYGGARQLDAEQMGSKRMVDLFLSSRRRRIAGHSEESNGVFL